ncbi:MAG: hypothetical protein MUF54_01070 [Polyangiaceae bacterium]|nr:hypothetical protein [Polyangiaceae bacterium]
MEVRASPTGCGRGLLRRLLSLATSVLPAPLTFGCGLTESLDGYGGGIHAPADVGVDQGQAGTGGDAGMVETGGTGGQGGDASSDAPIDVHDDVPSDVADSGPPPICASSTTLEELVLCIGIYMARSESEGFVVPTAAQRADWRSVVTRMLQGSCDFLVPPSLVPAMHLRSFVDSGNSKTYCVLMEVEDAQPDGAVDRGWGTVVVDPNSARELCQAAPHPLADIDTEVQAIGIFKGTGSRICVLAGTHRDANAASSTCQSSSNVSDVTHNTSTMFHATTEALRTFYGSTPWVQIQWHGMAASSCASEVFITHGSSRAPNSSDSIVTLADNMRTAHSSWKIDLAGSTQCDRTGATKVQARLLNGVPEGSVCTTSASTYTGKFISIEQAPGFRDAADWVAAIHATWP